MAVRSFEGHDTVSIPFHRPAQLVHGVMMSSAQCDEVGEIGLTAQDPRQHVVHLREVGISATRETAALIPTIDLDALGPCRTSTEPFLVEYGAVATFQREDHLRIAGQTTGHFP